MPEGQVHILERAALCFEAMPGLDHISIWTGEVSSILARAAFRIQRDKSCFWMNRATDDEDAVLRPSDVDDDRAAAACLRFRLMHDLAAHDLAVKYGLDDEISVLSFHRSGQAYFVSDAAYVLRRKLGRSAGVASPSMMSHVHPVFETEANGHQLMSWMSAVWTDIRCIRVNW